MLDNNNASALAPVIRLCNEKFMAYADELTSKGVLIDDDAPISADEVRVRVNNKTYKFAKDAYDELVASKDAMKAEIKASQLEAIKKISLSIEETMKKMMDEIMPAEAPEASTAATPVDTTDLVESIDIIEPIEGTEPAVVADPSVEL